MKNINYEAGERILAENYTVINDTTTTDLNNNDLIIGPSGAGKTMGYVKPNIRQFTNSMIVADTKSSLSKELSAELKAHGYTVHTVDFVNPEKSTAAYNPLNYIRKHEDGRYREQDIMTVSYALIPPSRAEDAFWETGARNILACLISFVLEAFPDDNPNLSKVVDIYNLMSHQIANLKSRTKPKVAFLDEWALDHPDSFAVKRYYMFKDSITAEKMWGSFVQFVTNALSPFEFKEAEALFMKEGDFRIEHLGDKPTVLFLNISDSDRTFDGLINLFYTQALQSLMWAADKTASNRLKVPVRIILDDFAANAVIPDFDKIISVIRSRSISVSIILQSLTQLESMYREASAMTIVNNCDHVIYLGGSDRKTAEYVALRVDKSIQTVLCTPASKVWIMERGKKGVQRDKYDFRKNDAEKKSNTPAAKKPAEKKPAAKKSTVTTGSK